MIMAFFTVTIAIHASVYKPCIVFVVIQDDLKKNTVTVFSNLNFFMSHNKNKTRFIKWDIFT